MTLQCRVLLIEDNPDVSLACRRILNMRGHQVFAAFDGIEALSVAHKVRLDVVVCDLSLPRMDGFEFVKALRADPDPLLAHLPVCALTGQCDQEDRARRSGFDEFFVKTKPLCDLIDFVERSG